MQKLLIIKPWFCLINWNVCVEIGKVHSKPWCADLIDGKINCLVDNPPDRNRAETWCLMLVFCSRPFQHVVKLHSCPLIKLLQISFIRVGTEIPLFRQACFYDLLWNEYPDESCVATGGGGVQRRPELIVLSVNVSASVQQNLHHLLVVVYTTLWANKKSACHNW